MRDAYRDAGVDIHTADALVERIKPLATRTQRPGVLGGIGGFGGLFTLPEGYKRPVLVSGTDGVGTKLLLAQQLRAHATIGIDLVAMCVNDILVQGAEPLFFLDYFATGVLDSDAALEVISGIAEGCLQAGCALLGGETAEMPGMYSPGHYDLAGFVVGVAEYDALPDPASIHAGDVVIGLPSNGIHSNGYSLVRKVFEGADLHENHGLSRPLGEILLDPTTIYVSDVLPHIRSGKIKGAAHITGGGLPGNLPRCLPDGLGATLSRDQWEVPPIFDLLQSRGQLSDADMLQTFNLGLGMVLVVEANEADAIASATGGLQVGVITDRAGVIVQ